MGNRVGGAGHQQGEGWPGVGNRVGGQVISGERVGNRVGGQFISGERLDGGGQVISYYPG